MQALVYDQVLLENVVRADTFKLRLCGLMFRKGLPEGEGLLLSPCNMVHCFFMRFAIDLIFLDKDSRIIRLIPSLKPWRVSPLVKGAVSVLECNPRVIERSGIKCGQVVKLSP